MGTTRTSQIGQQTPGFTPQLPRGHTPIVIGDIVVGHPRGNPSSPGYVVQPTQVLKPGTAPYNEYVAQVKKNQQKIDFYNGIIIAGATVVGGPLAGAAVKLSMKTQEQFSDQPIEQPFGGTQSAPDRGTFAGSVILPSTDNPFGSTTIPPNVGMSQGTAVNTVVKHQGFWEWLFSLFGIEVNFN